MYQPPIQTRNNLSTLFVRIGLLLAFFLLVGRLFQLQVVQGNTYQSQADENRFRPIEVQAPRGVIYDRNGEILARNRSSFAIAVVPAELPPNLVSTPDVDEQYIALDRILRAMEADTDPAIALGIADAMFRRLGRSDFARAVEGAGVDLSYRIVDLPVYSEDAEGNEIVREVPTLIPDLARPLPLAGLIELVQRAVEFGTQGSSFEPIPIMDLVDEELAFRMAEEQFQLQGLQVLQEPVRRYPFGEIASHVLGFMGPIPAGALDNYQDRGYNNPNERVGLNGLEFTYQDILRGKPGQETIEVDILGSKTRTVGQVVNPVPGGNLILSLDIRLQQKMHEVLERTLEETGAPHAVSIAMDPVTGSILGLVSLPSYNNNIFSEGLGEEYLALEARAREDSNRNPLINYAIGGLYPPGSTFKMTSAAGALMENVISTSTTIADNGPIYLPNRYFPNDPSQAQPFVSWNHKLGIVHGPMTVVEALGLSNDIFFYWIGGGYPNSMVGLGQEGLAKWTRLFGFGDASGIDLPGEVTALVPDDQWKRRNLAESWTTGDSYNMSIGQGYVLSTPLQVLVSAAAVANGGKIIEPRMVYQVVDSEGGLQQDFEPTVVRELPISPEAMDALRRGMWSVVNAPYGTARNAAIPGVVAAGKTGTAEFCAWDPELEDCSDRDDQGFLPFHSWYVGYAPYDNPEIAIVTFVYDGGEGSAVAAPATQEMMNYYFNEMGQVEPTETPPTDGSEETEGSEEEVPQTPSG